MRKYKLWTNLTKLEQFKDIVSEEYKWLEFANQSSDLTCMVGRNIMNIMKKFNSDNETNITKSNFINSIDTNTEDIPKNLKLISTMLKVFNEETSDKIESILAK